MVGERDENGANVWKLIYNKDGFSEGVGATLNFDGTSVGLFEGTVGSIVDSAVGVNVDANTGSVVGIAV